MTDNKNLNKIVSVMRRTIDDYQMISDGDRICVGVSGGKDSLATLAALKYYQRFSPQKFELVAVIIDLFNGATDYTQLLNYINELGVEVHVINSHIYDVVFEERKEENPCSLCAKLRRGILNTKAQELGCNKIALGHHADDLIETFFLSLCYESRLSTFHPITYLNKVNISVIRPMIYIPEKLIKSWAKDKPIVHNCCPADKHTQRQYMKDLLHNLEKDMPKVKQRIHGALIHSERNNLIPISHTIANNVPHKPLKKIDFD